MALPVIGVAVALLRANTAAKLFGGAGKDTAGAVGNIRLKVSWAKGGRGIRKAERRMAASAKRAALKSDVIAHGWNSGQLKEWVIHCHRSGRRGRTTHR